MTFAEIIVLIAVVAVLYFFMIPLQRRLESSLYRFFRSTRNQTGKPVIDITEYSKKGKKNEI
jgi:hypothetical protein